MTLKLTPKQREILLLIRDGQLRWGYSPTLQEIADELDVSKVTVFEHVRSLMDKGALKRDRNRARSLELTKKAKLPDEERTTRLPLVGRIAAGAPIEAIEDQESLDLEELFTRGQGTSGDTFVLEVEGDSMIDEHIREGDYVVCRRTAKPRSGQTVVALLEDGEATLKKFYREKGRIRLQPANVNYDPIYPDDCQIQGVVIGVIRAY